VSPASVATLRLAALLTVGLAGRQARAETFRFAVVVGANHGVAPSQPLRYAERDAERFASALAQVGRVSPENLTVLRAPARDDIRRALDAMDVRIRSLRRAPGDRTLLLFYFSGHADGVHLEVGGEHFPYGELRDRLGRSAADIRIAFVDTCQAGALTRDKGVSRGPSFDIVLPDALDAGGAAFVTSSSVDEVAQESAELESSYFTHFLISALRGAADADSDGRVTLSEAYRYAYVRTLAETARTMAGPQHPTYAYRITGRSDVTLSDLRGSPATLVFPAGSGGEYLVFDGSHRELLAEVVIEPGDGRRLGVPAGRVLVVKRQRGRLLAGRFDVSTGGETVVAESALKVEPIVLGRPKGLLADLERNAVIASYGVTGGALGSFDASGEMSLGFRRFWGTAWTWSARATLGLADVEQETFRYHYRAFGGELAGSRRIFLGAVELYAGMGVGLVWAEQQLVGGPAFSGLVARPSLAGGLEVPVGGHVMLVVAWNAGASLLRLNDAVAARPFVRGSLGVGYAF
jgi:Caspase domain